MIRHTLIVVFTSVLATFALPQVSQAYDLEWDQTEVKIELNPGEKEAKAKFVVTNKGDETVHIDRIKTSCGCTGSILDQKNIQPGESTTIIGTFNKGNRQGLNHNRLQVFLKNQPEPVETLHMLVNVPQLIEAQPSIVYWNKSSSKTGRKVQIKLDTRYVSKISQIKYNAELLTITEEEDPDSPVDYVLHILPKSFDTQLRQTVLIKATGKDGMAAETKLQVFVQP